jgi:chromosome segregation ATPase
MAKFFLVLTLIACAAAAGLGWETYTKISEVKTTLATTKKSLDDTQKKLTTTQFALKDAQDNLAATKTQLDTANETIKTTQAQLDEANKNLTAATAQVTDLTTQLASAKETIKHLMPINPNAPVDNSDPKDKLISDLQNKVKEDEQLQKTLQDKADQAEKHAQELVDKENTRLKNVARPGIEGMVMAVNQGWSFAVISLGDHQGAVPNAEVLVKRGDTLIAKLRITTVEPTTSIADIVADSVAKGQRVLPGDKVVFTGPPSGQ